MRIMLRIAPYFSNTLYKFLLSECCGRLGRNDICHAYIYRIYSRFRTATLCFLTTIMIYLAIRIPAHEAIFLLAHAANEATCNLWVYKCIKAKITKRWFKVRDGHRLHPATVFSFRLWHEKTHETAYAAILRLNISGKLFRSIDIVSCPPLPSQSFSPGCDGFLQKPSPW
jgi:hypothetical protein